jgi:hypothetical protein
MFPFEQQGCNPLYRIDHGKHEENRLYGYLSILNHHGMLTCPGNSQFNRYDRSILPGRKADENRTGHYDLGRAIIEQTCYLEEKWRTRISRVLKKNYWI